nr:olfactory receptor 28 [Gregopimpla kuwanae]
MGDEKMGDVFQQSRYRINVILLTVVGQWPFQETNQRRITFGVTLFFSCSLFVAQVRKVYFEGDDLSVVFEAVAPFIFEGICASNLLNNVFNVGIMRQMLKFIEGDWKNIQGEEKRILTAFADEGYMLNVFYAVWIYGSMTLFLILPIVSKVIVAFGWANMSEAVRFQVPVDYYVDDHEYYVYLQMHLCIAVTLMCTIIIASDIMFIMLVQHACGMFSAVSHTLEHLVEDEDLELDLYPRRTDDETFWIVVDCIKKQNSAIKFTELLESGYCWSFFFVVGFNMGLLTFAGFQIIMHSDSVDEAIRQGLFTGGEMVHLFFENYLSQRLTDHSLCVYEAINKARWYKTSMRTRKLLNFMLLRSVIPCTLRAGKIYDLSMENFSKLVRTSVSYFTVLCSFQ